jgi:hypothetical protein
MADTTVFPLEPLIDGAASIGFKKRSLAAQRRRDDSQARTWEARAQQHARAYKGALEELGLSQPIVRVEAQRRVAASGRL